MRLQYLPADSESISSDSRWKLNGQLTYKVQEAAIVIRFVVYGYYVRIPMTINAEILISFCPFFVPVQIFVVGLGIPSVSLKNKT